MGKFTVLGVGDKIEKALNEMGIDTPTEVQQRAIPFLIKEGSDFIGQAQTGTGKTAAFGLPLLHYIDPKINQIQGLILCPTRELGLQIAKQIFKYTKYCKDKIYTETVYGGAPIDNQKKALQRPTHILVATPGRLIELLGLKALELSKVKKVILDEADEMLRIGFKEDIDKILTFTKGSRDIWLFSATMPQGIKSIIQTYMATAAKRIEINKKERVNKNIEHQFLICDVIQKPKILVQFIKSQGTNRGIIFCRTKSAAKDLADFMSSSNMSVAAIHGDLKQIEREKVMRAFKNKKLQILLSTDIAARGIDVANLSFVVHYQLPDQIEYYTHRSGRTARAGKEGLSICFINRNELKTLRKYEKSLSITFKQIRTHKK